MWVRCPFTPEAVGWYAQFCFMTLSMKPLTMEGTSLHQIGQMTMMREAPSMSFW